MRPLKTLTLALFLIGTLPMFGAIYIKFDGIDGESTAAGHEKWIELGSLQNADGTPMTAMLDQGRVRISSSSLVAQLGPLCQSGRPLGNVLLDVNGMRHMLRNARFVECPNLRGNSATAVLEFGAPPAPAKWPSKLEIGALKAGAQPATLQRGNASISGLARAPLTMDIRRASILGNVATVALKGGTVSETLGKAILEASAKGTVFPLLVIESAGQQWSFTNAMFTSASYSQTQDTLFSLQFETMNGSAAAFQALGH